MFCRVTRFVGFTVLLALGCEEPEDHPPTAAELAARVPQRPVPPLPPLRAPEEGEEKVSGVVTEFVDRQASDGGIRVYLKTDDGRQLELALGALHFRGGPPPSEARQILHRKVNGTEKGVRVSAITHPETQADETVHRILDFEQVGPKAP